MTGASPPPSVINDPIVTGFDGQVFEFHATGLYNLLAADEWKVDATFLDPFEGQSDEKKSLTSRVRVSAPNGESVTCTLASLSADTKLQMITSAADGSEAAPMKTSLEKQIVKLDEIEADIAPMDLPGLAQCTIRTPKFTLTVNHVSGAEQALRFPDAEAWAAKYTWLDTSFELKGALNPPVTGILGATYPVKTPEDLLRFTNAAAEGVADVAGRRTLQGGSKYDVLPKTAGVKVEFHELNWYGRRLSGSRAT